MLPSFSQKVAETSSNWYCNGCPVMLTTSRYSSPQQFGWGVIILTQYHSSRYFCPLCCEKIKQMFPRLNASEMAGVKTDEMKLIRRPRE